MWKKIQPIQAKVSEYLPVSVIFVLANAYLYTIANEDMIVKEANIKNLLVNTCLIFDGQVCLSVCLVTVTGRRGSYAYPPLESNSLGSIYATLHSCTLLFIR